MRQPSGSPLCRARTRQRHPDYYPRPPE